MLLNFECKSSIFMKAYNFLYGNSLFDAAQSKLMKNKSATQVQIEGSFFFPMPDQSVRIRNEGYLRLSLLYNYFELHLSNVFMCFSCHIRRYNTALRKTGE